MLSIENVTSAYGRIEVLHGVTLRVEPGEIVTLIGANGAGKTTLMHAISGVQPITGGAIRFNGEPIEKRPAHERVAFGISQVPEGRQVFAPLSVLDNLRLGAWSRRDTDMEPELARVCALFPMLDAILDTPAGALSGGQQQMLAIGRALMAKPRLLLLDEPSMGLAPNLVDQLLAVMRALQGQQPDHPLGGTKCARRVGNRRPRLRAGDRPRDAERTGGRNPSRSPRQGSLFRYLKRSRIDVGQVDHSECQSNCILIAVQ